MALKSNYSRLSEPKHNHFEMIGYCGSFSGGQYWEYFAFNHPFLTQDYTLGKGIFESYYR